MTPEDFLSYLKGVLDAQDQETPLIKLLKKKLQEVEPAPKVKFPVYRSPLTPPIVPLKREESIPSDPDWNKPYC